MKTSEEIVEYINSRIELAKALEAEADKLSQAVTIPRVVSEIVQNEMQLLKNFIVDGENESDIP